jgi:hypothetical protein
VTLIVLNGDSAKVLTHAVQLVNVDTQRTKVFQEFSGKWGGPAKEEFALVETEFVLDFAENDLVYQPIVRRFAAGTPELSVHLVCQSLGLCPCRDLLLETFRLGTDGLDLQADLFPQERLAFFFFF